MVVFLIEILSSKWKLEIFKMKALLFCIANSHTTTPPPYPPLIFSIFKKGFKRFGVVHVATGINNAKIYASGTSNPIPKHV